MQDQELSPLMRQYRTVKAQHPEAILFFRVGDFYEMFFEDAEEASSILGIVLTARGKAKGTSIPSLWCATPHRNRVHCETPQSRENRGPLRAG